MSDFCSWPRCACKSTGIKCKEQQKKDIKKPGRTKIRNHSKKAALEDTAKKAIQQLDFQFYWLIWLEREHSCQNCGAILYEFLTFHFHHILAKRDKKDGGYPQYRHCKWNIWLLCHICHDTNDNGNPDSKTLVKLRSEYYRLLSLHENGGLDELI